MKSYDKQFIGGEWRTGTGSAVMENCNPFSGEVLYTYRSAGPDDIDAAYKAAAAAQPAWEALLPSQKQALFLNFIEVVKKRKEEFFEVLLKESGSFLPKCEAEFFTVQEIAQLVSGFPTLMTGKTMYSNIPGKENFIFRKAKGVIGIIAPWNVPMILTSRSALPALATGNTIVIKPSSDTPASALLLGELFEEAGFPKGTVNVIAGKGSEIGDTFVQHPIPALISFTGSTTVGRRVGQLAGYMVKDVSLELGGNNPMIVLKDANVEKAVAAAVFGANFHQGQICMALNRIIVVKDVYEQFAQAYVEAVKHLPVGDPANSGTFIGPIINKSQIEHIEKLIDGTVKAGATVALEGRTEGNLIHPWVFTNITNDMPAAREEVFGPVTSIIKAEDEDDAIAIANDTEYGLSSSIFTEDRYNGMKVARRIQSGMAHVNDQSFNDETHVMFGGEKMSGVGRFNAEWVLDKFTTQQWVSVQYQYRF